MNTVFEEYERRVGTERGDLINTTTSYAWILLEDMMNALLVIRIEGRQGWEKITRLNALKEQLVRCTMDKVVIWRRSIVINKNNKHWVMTSSPFHASLILCAVNIQGKTQKWKHELTPEEFENIAKEAT